MSHTTLQDYYQGMKMPTYDGNNIYQQIRRMNEPIITKKVQTTYIQREMVATDSD